MTHSASISAPFAQLVGVHGVQTFYLRAKLDSGRLLLTIVRY